MISFRQADLIDKINKPKPFYSSFDDDWKNNPDRHWDPIAKKMSSNPNTEEGQIYWSGPFTFEKIFKVSDYYVGDDASKKNDQVFIRNDYVGKYSHIDESGNFVFSDNTHSKFKDTIFPIKNWVLDSNHERGLHLNKRQ